MVIELLGPRWRRHARISDAPPRTPASKATPVTPTITDGPPGERPAGPARVPAPAARATVGAGSLAAAPPAGGLTLVRPARRHAGADELEADAAAVPRRRTPQLVAAGLAVVAVIAGGVVGGLTAGGSTTTRTTTAPAVALAANVRPLVRTLSDAQRADASRLDSARTARGQAAAAEAEAGVYAAAEQRLRALPGTQVELAAAASLDSALARVGGEWRSLAAAAAAGSRGAYDAAAAALAHGQQALTSAVLVAERGH